MKNILKKIGMLVATPLMLLAFSGTAQAVITAGGATIHNAATLTFTGGTVVASVDVSVQTIASAPAISVDLTAKTVAAGDPYTFTYSVSSNSNGSDTFSFTAGSTNSVNISAPGLPAITSLTLGASITSASNTVANTIQIPVGSDANMIVGDALKVAGDPYSYTIASITPGTVASHNVTTGALIVEVPTVITLTPVTGPGLAIGAAPAGTQVGELQTFTYTVTAGIPNDGVNGTHTVNLSGVTTATTQGVAPAAVTYNTTAGPAEGIITVTPPTATLTKTVRNLTNAEVAMAGTTAAKAGDVIEYQLLATAGTSNIVKASISDAIPAFTTILAGQYNGGLSDVQIITTVAGVPTTTFGTNAADADVVNLTAGNLTINLGAGAASADVAGNGGTVNANDSVAVTFQVTVN